MLHNLSNTKEANAALEVVYDTCYLGRTILSRSRIHESHPRTRENNDGLKPAPREI